MANLVPVGQVFKVFPGKRDFNYYGIEVTGNPFAQKSKLVFRPPDGDGSNDVVMKVSTIEINRQRTNIVKVGQKCAIRPAQVPKTEPGPNWTVLVRAEQAATAQTYSQELTPRPNPPAELTSRRHRYTF